MMKNLLLLCFLLVSVGLFAQNGNGNNNGVSSNSTDDIIVGEIVEKIPVNDNDNGNGNGNGSGNEVAIYRIKDALGNYYFSIPTNASYTASQIVRARKGIRPTVEGHTDERNEHAGTNGTGATTVGAYVVTILGLVN